MIARGGPGARPASPTRRWHRLASAVLLIAAGVHLSLHLRSFERGDGAVASFSLAYAAALILFGTSQWVLAREADPRTLRRHAMRNALLFALADLALVLLHPQPHVVVVFGLAAVLYAIAAWPRPLDL